MDGEVPSLRSLKGATLTANSPDGESSQRVTVEGFAVSGGRASDARFKQTGRVDVRVSSDGNTGEPIGLQWVVDGP